MVRSFNGSIAWAFARALYTKCVSLQQSQTLSWIGHSYAYKFALLLITRMCDTQTFVLLTPGLGSVLHKLV